MSVHDAGFATDLDVGGPTAGPRLQITGLDKSYGAAYALRDVSLSVAPGEIHALCGHNGAGKSTLIKILSGVIEPDAGLIQLNGSAVGFRNPQQAQQAGVALVDQEISLIEALTVSDNILLGLADASFINRPRSVRQFVTEALRRVDLADVDPDVPVSRLTLGERQLVEIARAFGRGSSLLVLDEPTATLSEAEAAKVFRAIRPLADHGTSIIFVSHRLGEVLELCDRVTVLRDGALVGTKAVTPALDRSELVEMMVGSLHESGGGRVHPVTTGAPVVRIKGLAVPGRLEGLDLDIYPGQIVALAGQVGSGASECLRALAGLESGVQGTVSINGRPASLRSPVASRRAGLHFVSNDRKAQGLFLERSVDKNLIATRLDRLSRFGVIGRVAARGASRLLAETAGLTVRRSSQVSELSGGNQQKVFVGRSLDQDGAAVLLLDEPTRGVDVAGRADIHALIRGAAESGTAVLYASTEGDEILDLADVVVALCAGCQVSTRPREEVSVARLVAEMTHPELGDSR